MGGIVAASVMFPINCVAHKTRRIADKYRSDAHCDTCPRVGARLCLVPCSPLSRSHSHNSLPEPCPAWPHSNGLIAVLLPGLSCYTGPGLPAIPPCLTYTQHDVFTEENTPPGDECHRRHIYRISVLFSLYDGDTAVCLHSHCVLCAVSPCPSCGPSLSFPGKTTSSPALGSGPALHFSSTEHVTTRASRVCLVSQIASKEREKSFFSILQFILFFFSKLDSACFL